ncbi:penicillin-binding protein 1A [Kovacikia minuta CCNUW1]|uniref:transglycosylase domain-containing protein n=1 Tax=Kovacikia minuta TaxID=2931930 RepID=UPI001CCEFAAC|nr:penicillin-binding protein 1A [Kovacikia minuta]UBF23724.1 penicillin-binding protein 1A [Kovacikia minuta CCNUW1]
MGSDELNGSSSNRHAPRSAPLSRRGRNGHTKNGKSLFNVPRSPFRDAPETDLPDLETSLPQEDRQRRKPWHRRRAFWLALVVVGGGGLLAWGYSELERSLPDTGAISKFVREGTLTIKAADGTTLQQLGPATRDKLLFAQIPPLFVQAFVASEDHRFFQHRGVDYQSIVRAVANNLVARDVVEGGSTITQQLARIVYLNQDRNLGRKVQEAFLAQKIEREMDKQQILEKYLNLVYLGSGAYGVADAAWVYFSKSVNQLTLAEMATIAGLPPAPSDYSPLVNLPMAQKRRNIVLDRMQEAGYITAAEAEQARSQPLVIKPSAPKKLYSDTPYFTSYIQQQLPKLISKEQLEAGGLTVETTLNPFWQRAAQNAIKNAVKNIGPYEGFSQAALVAIDPRTGEVRAMVGGTDFSSSQFNRATQAQRQPGSSFKPILYTTAIATGMSPYSSYLNAPITVDGYKPENFDKKYTGWMTLRQALTNSINTISVRLIIDTGFDPVIKMAREMGIKSTLLPTYSLALGASEVNLLELTNAYGTLAARGLYTEAHGIRRIVNSKGEVLFSADFKSRRAIDKGTVAIISWMMESVVSSGTGQAAQIGRPVAGKTGTSENARDLWFIGFIPQIVAGVWLGNDDNSPTWSASSTAALVWHDFMTTAAKGMPVQPFMDLPNLDTRKGSIKAKPVQPNRMYNGGTSSPDSSSSSDSYSGGGYSRPAEQSGGRSEPSPESSNDSPAPPPEAAPSEAPPLLQSQKPPTPRKHRPSRTAACGASPSPNDLWGT